MEEKNKQEEKIKQAKDLLKQVEEIEKKTSLEKFIKDNKIEFKLKLKNKLETFRVRKITFKEQEEINIMRMKKYKEMLSATDESGNLIYEFKKEWIEKLKKRNIDITSMEQEIQDLNKRIENTLYKLAPIKDKEGIETLKKEVIDLREKQAQLSITVTDYLHYSIEDQLNTYVSFYTCYLVLERKDKDNWIRVFKNYDEFENCDNANLINQAIYFANLLIYENTV